MSNVRIELNSDGVKQLLKSSEMMAICSEQARNIRNRCGDGYATDTCTGKNRVNAMVYADTPQAKKDNSAHNTILKAMK